MYYILIEGGGGKEARRDDGYISLLFRFLQDTCHDFSSARFRIKHAEPYMRRVFDQAKKNNACVPINIKGEEKPNTRNQTRGT
jgi:hypothetical protein